MKKAKSIALALFVFTQFSAISQSSVLGNWLEFDGLDVSNILDGGDYVQIPDDLSLDFSAAESFSIQFWINPKNFGTTNGDFQGIVAKKTKTGKGYGVFWAVNGTGGRIRFILDDGPNSKSLSSGYMSTVNSSGWTHVTVVMEREMSLGVDSVYMYFNGQLEAKSVASSIDDVSSTNDLLLMNYSGNSSNLCSGGSLDEVRIFATALKPRQIQRLYNEPIAQASNFVRGTQSARYTLTQWQDLRGYWQMEDLSGGIPGGYAIADASAESNTGYLVEGSSPTNCSTLGCGPVFKTPIPANTPIKTYVAVNTGNWSEGSTWSGGNAPSGEKAIVFINDNITITIDGVYSCEAIAVKNGGFLSSDDGSILNVYKYFDIDGAFSNNLGKVRFTGNGDHTVEGDLVNGTSSINFYHFEMDQANSQVQIKTPIRIEGVLYHTNGTLKTEDQLTLAAESENAAATTPFGMIDLSGNPDVQGLIYMEKKLRDNSEGHRQMSMPLKGVITDFSGITLNVLNSPNASDPNVFVWENDQNLSLPLENIGWIQASDTCTNVTPFSVFLNGTDYSAQTPFTLKGTYTFGDYVFPLTFLSDPGSSFGQADPEYYTGQGWTFIPNIYPSLLDVTKMVNDNPLAYPNIHVWDAITQQYVSFLAGSSAAVIPYNNTPIGINSNYNAIEPFQSFWVKTTDATETQYLLKNTYRSTDYNGLTPAPTLKAKNALQINVFSAVDSTWDGVVVGFDPSASETFENDKDSYKLFSPANVPSLYLMASEKTASVNTIPVNSLSTLLYFRPSKAASSNQYFLSLDNTRSTSKIYVFLEDLKSNTIHNMNVSSYSFEHTIGQNEERFKLYFSVSEEFNRPSNLENIRVAQNSEAFIIKDFHSNELAEIYLYDVSGRTLFSHKAQLNHDIVIPKHIRKGVAVLKVITFNQSVSKKVFLN